MSDTVIVALLSILAVVKIADLVIFTSLPHCCPSCNGRFDEKKVNLFCKIGSKEVYFCKKCTDRPVGRLSANNPNFVAKGFTFEEIRELQNCIYMYKH